jgi:hypothetical protein
MCDSDATCRKALAAFVAGLVLFLLTLTWFSAILYRLVRDVAFRHIPLRELLNPALDLVAIAVLANAILATARYCGSTCLTHQSGWQVLPRADQRWMRRKLLETVILLGAAAMLKLLLWAQASHVAGG